MKSLWAKEPARIVLLVSAVVSLAVSFGLHLSETQVGAIMAIISLLAGEAVRSQVSPAPSNSGPPLPPIAMLLVIALTGCASVRRDAVLELNTAATFARDAEQAIEHLDLAEQEAALATSDPVKARQAVVAIRARYAVTWRAYRAFRVAWLAAATAVRVSDDESVVSATTALVTAENDFARLMVNP